MRSFRRCETPSPARIAKCVRSGAAARPVAAAAIREFMIRSLTGLRAGVQAGPRASPTRHAPCTYGAGDFCAVQQPIGGSAVVGLQQTTKGALFMAGLARTISNLSRQRGDWTELLKAAEGAGRSAPPSRLREVHGFGSNPGNLRMLEYVPARLAPGP